PACARATSTTSRSPRKHPTTDQSRDWGFGIRDSRANRHAAQSVQRPMMRLFVAAVAIALTAQSPITRSPITRSDSPIFRFHTGEFWLNLHHFLYVLGR